MGCYCLSKSGCRSKNSYHSKYNRYRRKKSDTFFQTSKVSLFRSDYRRRCHIKNFQPDPAGPLYICTGVAGNVRYYDIPASHFDEKLAPQPETDNYLVLETAKNRLHLQAFLPNGALMDEIFLVKR